jgi:phenylpropionate dioxygenase-like ring-hydroxylating dioxygenase large terminal subunit
MSNAPAPAAPSGQKIPNGMLEDNYPRNIWWVAAWSHELADKPLARRLLDRAVVLYRGDDGVVALDDRCPHRWAPLSAGAVHGNTIVCPYHGMRFAPDGRCTHIPTQEMIPATLRVRSYPTVERNGVVWIWMGDEDRLAHSPQPPDELMAGAEWSTIYGYFHLEFNFMLLRENVLDLTHFPFVHSASFGQNDWVLVPEVETSDWRVLYRAQFENSPLSGVFCGPLGIPAGKRMNRTQVGELITPAIHFSRWLINDPTPEDGARREFEMRTAHITTPISAHATHYFWCTSFDVTGVRHEIMDTVRASIMKGFQEDVDLLTKVHRNVRQDARGLDYPEVNVGADKAGVHARRILQRYLEKERAPSDHRSKREP